MAGMPIMARIKLFTVCLKIYVIIEKEKCKDIKGRVALTVNWKKIV